MPLEIMENMLIKYDALSVDAMDKIHICLNLLIDNGYIEKKATLKETYESVLGIYNIERTDLNMWKMVLEHKIQSLFQMEKQSGIQGIELLKPTSVDDMAILNSTIRLMAQEGSDEMPTEKLSRFKANPRLWIKEMEEYGLTKEEQEVLKPILNMSYGLCIAQEQFMELVQLPALGGFSLTWADRLRKSIAKKSPKDYDALTKEFFETAKEKNISSNFADYVWNRLIALSRGYGFNQSHTLAYSLIALQEMNLAYKYPIVFWNCACLISNSGSNGASTDYNKVASALGKMINAGIKIEPPDINQSLFNFIPDPKNNAILFGLKGIAQIGDDLVETIIKNRPYKNPKDFLIKVNPTKQPMIALIKSGAFDNMMDRKLCMAWYLWETCDKKKKITLQNLNGLMSYGLLPENTEERIMARRIYEFNRYIKALNKGSLKPYYKIDERSVNFINDINKSEIICYNNDISYILKADWDNIYQFWMNVFRNWISEDKDNILIELNNKIFKEDWDKYALGNISAWEMESLCFYYHEHELANVNRAKYNLIPFDRIPETPVIERTFEKGNKTINMYQLYKICGTCIAKDRAHGTVSLLTSEGVVEVKFAKDYFSMFNKIISQRDIDGTKRRIEKSWFDRGSMIIVQGIREGNMFMAKSYRNSSGHKLYKIDEVLNNGDLILRTERAKGDAEDEMS